MARPSYLTLLPRDRDAPRPPPPAGPEVYVASGSTFLSSGLIFLVTRVASGPPVTRELTFQDLARILTAEGDQ